MVRSKKAIQQDQSQTYCQPNNNRILYAIMAVVTVFSFYLFLRVQKLEKKLASGGTGTQQAQAASPLEVNKLKAYAKELKLNTGKFNKCLDSGEKAKQVTADTQYGSSLGVQGTPGFFINGKFLAGAFPFSMFKEIIDKEIAGTGSEVCTDYSTDLQKYCSDPQQKAFDPVAKKIEVGNVPSTGVANPKVTIVEFSDFECPFCVRAYPTVEQVLKEYKDDVAFYFRQFPLTQIHKFAQKAAEASLCAADQGKFWEWHNKISDIEVKAQGQ